MFDIEKEVSSLIESFKNLLINTNKTDIKFQNIEQAWNRETNESVENSEMSEKQKRELILENILPKEQMLAHTKNDHLKRPVHIKNKTLAAYSEKLQKFQIKFIKQKDRQTQDLKEISTLKVKNNNLLKNINKKEN